jgi:hypothetical protein
VAYETTSAYFGHHKCGTVWIGKVVEGVCQSTNLKIDHHHDELRRSGADIGRAKDLFREFRIKIGYMRNAVDLCAKLAFP